MELPFLLLFIAIPLVVYFVIAQGKRTNEAWTQAARTLGLQCTVGGFLRGPTIRGTLHGCGVLVEIRTRGGKNRQSFTRFTVRYPKRLGLGLRLTREGFFTGVAKFFGGQDIEVGDRAFDDDIRAEARNKSRLLMFLTPARRLRIHRFLRSNDEATIEDSEIVDERRGVARNAIPLARHIETMARLAWHLTGERDEDASVDTALAARKRGSLDDALAELQRNRSAREETRRKRSEDEPPSPLPLQVDAEPVEETALRGEILHLAGREEEAAEAFEEAVAFAPSDEELMAWLADVEAKGPEAKRVPRRKAPRRRVPRRKVPRREEARRKASRPAAPQPAAPQPAAPTPAAPPVLPATPAAEAPAGAGAAPIDIVAFCAELFPPGYSSFESGKLFDSQHRGKQVRWSGVLQSVDRFSYDYIFGSEEGTKAILDVNKVETGMCGSDQLSVILQLPAASSDALRDRVGEQLEFTGELLKLDGLMLSVYVGGGQLLEG